jgi:hypothetical protein
MKNRLLPLTLFLFILGFSCLQFADTASAAGPDQDPYQTDLLMKQILSNQHTGMINPSDVLAARYQRSLMKQKSTAALGLNWMPVGPINWAGRVRAVLYDNQDASGSTIYTGGVMGGVYKSVNGGLSWEMLNQGSDDIIGVSCMVQTPSGALYVGTGEYYEFAEDPGVNASGQIGNGIYRSTNGMDFEQITATKPLPNDPMADWAQVLRLACDPASGRLFAATNNALYYSDNGDVWTSVMNGLAANVVVGTNGTVVFVVDNHVYVAPAGDLGNIMDVSTGAVGKLPDANVGWIQVAIAPSNPDIMYATIARQYDYVMLGVYCSRDGGNTWSVIFPENPSYDPLVGVGAFCNSLEVFPNNPDAVLLGGATGWYGEKFQDEGYYDWQSVSVNGLGPNGAYAPLQHFNYNFNPANPSQFAIGTMNGVAIGNYSPDQFTYQTSNKNLAIGQFYSVEMGPIDKWMMGGGNNIGIELFNAVLQNDPMDGYVPPTSQITGTYGEWSLLKPEYIIFSGIGFDEYVRSEDLGETTALTFMGEVFNTLTNFIPSALWETDDFAFSVDTVWIYARNGAIEADSTVMASSMNCYQCPFEYTVPTTIPEGDSMAVIDPFHSRFFMFGTVLSNSGIYMTADAIKFYKDPEWFCIGNTGTDIITSLSVTSDLNYVWAATEDGKLYRFGNVAQAQDSVTADVGSPYCIVSKEMFEFPELSGRYITNVSIDPKDNNNVLVTLGNYGNENYIYLCQNALDSLPVFTSVQGDLPKAPVFDGIIEMHNNGTAIIGTDLGIFTTTNIFANQVEWDVDINGIGDVRVTNIKQQTWENYRIQNIGMIAASSFGRGLFYDTTFRIVLGQDDPVNNIPAQNALQIRPNPVKEAASVTFTLNGTTSVNATLFDLTGRVVQEITLGTYHKGTHTAAIDMSGLPSGTYVIRVNEAYGKIVKAN